MLEISEREEELPEAVIGKLLRIAAEDKSIASLGPGEPDFSLPKPLISEFKKIASKTINHYSPPAGRSDLREAIAKKVKKENKIKASPENVIVTAGSQEALLLTSLCTMDVSDQVLLPTPCFMGFAPMFELINTQVVPIQLKEENKFELNPDDLKKSINKKTKVLLINSPANPTGNVIRKKILEEIADIAIENNLYIFSDEAYEKITYDQKHYSIGSFNGMEKNVVTLQSYSKSYAMCGFRLGYAIANEELIKAMSKIHIYSSLSATTSSQMLGIKALQLPQKYTINMVKEYRKRRDYLVKRLNELNLPTPKPEGAFYTFSNIKNYSNNSFKFANDLLKKKVAVVPGIEFGSYGEGYIRCSYATDLKIIKIAMDRLEKFLKTYK